jgi:hypothetical protein
MTFDARTAKLLVPGSHIIIDDCPGLRLEASTVGRAWIYRFKSPVDFEHYFSDTIHYGGSLVSGETVFKK